MTALNLRVSVYERTRISTCLLLNCRQRNVMPSVRVYRIQTTEQESRYRVVFCSASSSFAKLAQPYSRISPSYGVAYEVYTKRESTSLSCIATLRTVTICFQSKQLKICIIDTLYDGIMSQEERLQPIEKYKKTTKEPILYKVTLTILLRKLWAKQTCNDEERQSSQGRENDLNYMYSTYV